MNKPSPVVPSPTVPSVEDRKLLDLLVSLRSGAHPRELLYDEREAMEMLRANVAALQDARAAPPTQPQPTALAAGEDGWIAVKDRLPEECETVWFVHSGIVSRGWWEEKQGFGTNSRRAGVHFRRPPDVSHWMLSCTPPPPPATNGGTPKTLTEFCGLPPDALEKHIEQHGKNLP